MLKEGLFKVSYQGVIIQFWLGLCLKIDLEISNPWLVIRGDLTGGPLDETTV